MKKKRNTTYPKATVATTTCVLEEIQLFKTELRNLLFNPAWYAEVEEIKFILNTLTSVVIWNNVTQ